MFEFLFVILLVCYCFSSMINFYKLGAVDIYGALDFQSFSLPSRKLELCKEDVDRFAECVCVYIYMLPKKIWLCLNKNKYNKLQIKNITMNVNKQFTKALL